MHDYIMNITLAKGSGEYCICKFCLRLPYRRIRDSKHSSCHRYLISFADMNPFWPSLPSQHIY